MIPAVGELFSIQGLLGGSFPAQGFLQNNSVVPIAALLGVWLVGGRLLRLATGLVPIAVMVLFMLGSDPGVKKIFGGSSEMLSGGSGMLDGGATFAGSLSQQGWLLPACVIGGIFLLGRRRLSFIHIVLAILAVSYLLTTRDFRLNSVLHSASSRIGMISIGGALLFLFLYRLLGGRSRRNWVAVPIGTQIASLKPVLVGAAVGVAGVFGLVLLFQPLLVEQNFPAWRSTFGIWMLCVSMYAFNQSLPGKFKQWMLPAFWCVVTLVIGAQLTHSHFASKPQSSAILEQF